VMPVCFQLSTPQKWRNCKKISFFLLHQFIWAIEKIVGLGSFGVGGEGAEVLCGHFLNHRGFQRKLYSEWDAIYRGVL
jgi:hypothetical protein